uniref:Uncharacterized protein n=1 Tax=Timema shepardi TaxID=629360 RepID=A0A7R9AW35_TIMSH|nr:unnamed protein product [Timema shepardi]
MASLVLTDRSQLTSESQHLGIYLNVDRQKRPISKHRSSPSHAVNSKCFPPVTVLPPEPRRTEQNQKQMSVMKKLPGVGFAARTVIIFLLLGLTEIAAAVKLNTTSALANYATEAGDLCNTYGNGFRD